MCGEPGNCEDKFFRTGWNDAACCEQPSLDSITEYSSASPSSSSISDEDEIHDKADNSSMVEAVADSSPCNPNPCVLDVMFYSDGYLESGTCHSNLTCNDVVLKNDYAFSEDCYTVDDTEDQEFFSCATCGYSMQSDLVNGPWNCIVSDSLLFIYSFHCWMNDRTVLCSRHAMKASKLTCCLKTAQVSNSTTSTMKHYSGIY